jgi:D-alanyl-D-alanine carboxypeptidase (penicillin-binding protein 5/6)
MASRRHLIAGAIGAINLGLAVNEAAAQQRPAPAPAQPPRRPPPRQEGTPVATAVGNVDVLSRQALIVDFETGATLLEKNADERMPPSSMSKLMTMYVVFDRLKQGRLQLDQMLPVSERAWRMGGSKMFVDIGQQVRVVQSGNDACIVLAEAISGSEQQFAELLNEYARRMGMTNSNFRNSTGWPDPEHRMTARDLSILARRLITDFPDYYRFYNERSFRFANISQDNRNPLLARVPGADGLKTGHTEEAGFGLTGSAMRDGRRVILVLNGLPSMRARAEESERLMEWAFREFEAVTLFRAQDTVEEVPVYLGERRTVPMVGGRDIVLTLPRRWRERLEVRVRYQAPLAAPVMRGQTIGELQVAGQGVPTLSVPLVAGADVEKLGLLPRIPAVIGRWVSGA